MKSMMNIDDVDSKDAPENASSSLNLDSLNMSEDQLVAFSALMADKRNIFLTGGAGTGKSYVIQSYIKHAPEKPAVLASTGAASLLIGGRTFHSFFGLKQMDGGVKRTVESAVRNESVIYRIKNAREIIIDEVSMLGPDTWLAADLIAKEINASPEPFGGIRVVAVGDFLQLPPVDKVMQNSKKLFDSKSWVDLNFQFCELTSPHRSDNIEFVKLLHLIRAGHITPEVEKFLSDRKKATRELIPEINDRNMLNDGSFRNKFEGTVLFGKKVNVEAYNDDRLKELEGDVTEFPTEVKYENKETIPKDRLIRMTPIPEVLRLKVGALVMIRINDVHHRFVNGSLAYVKEITGSVVIVRLMSDKKGALPISIAKHNFVVNGADGDPVASVSNFPLSLGYATTIHKSQGSSVDRLLVNLRSVWEFGQSYVALSRVRSPEGLFIEEYSTVCIKACGSAKRYYADMRKKAAAELSASS